MISLTGLILCLLFGTLIGLVSGFLGLGGGILIVPLLPVVADLSQHEVIGTSLFSIFLIVLNNTVSFHKKGLVVWPIVLVMGPITGLAAFFSARFGLELPEDVLKMILAVLLFIFGVITLLRKTPTIEKGQFLEGSMKAIHWTFLIMASLIAGTASGLTGIGSGLILGLVILNSRTLSNERLSPASNGIMIFTCAFGMTPYLFANTSGGSASQLGHVHLLFSIALVAGAVLTSKYSRKHQHRLPLHLRKYILTGLLFVLGTKILFSVL